MPASCGRDSGKHIDEPDGYATELRETKRRRETCHSMGRSMPWRGKEHATAAEQRATAQTHTPRSESGRAAAGRETNCGVGHSD